jgi:hypothetical protein
MVSECGVPTLPHRSVRSNSLFWLPFVDASVSRQYHTTCFACLACERKYILIRNQFPCFCHFLFSFFCLSVNGETQKAEKIINIIAEHNQTSPTQYTLCLTTHASNPKSEPPSLRSRLREWNSPQFFALNIALSLVFMFLSAAYYMSFVYFSEYLHTTSQKSNIHLIYTAAPLGRIFGSILSSIVIDDCGRLKLLQIGGLVSGISAGFLVLSENPFVLWAALFVMYCFLELVFCALYTYAPEVYPTNIRGMGVGILAGIGDSADVIFSYVGSIMSAHHPTTPILCSGVMLLIIAVIAFLLNWRGMETTGRDLGDSSDYQVVESAQEE